LRPVQAGDVTIDVCIGGCGGMWFDNFELKKVDEPRESAGDLLINVVPREGLAIDWNKKRRCPKCQDIFLMRHFFSPQRRVEVDECGNCGGIWLDAGELALIREEFQQDAERKRAQDSYFEEMQQRQLEPLRQSGQPDRARRIGNLLRFASPVRFQYQR
jgi:uncharacterized protein